MEESREIVPQSSETHIAQPQPIGKTFLLPESVSASPGHHMQIIRLAPSISQYNISPSPLEMLQALQNSQWKLNSKFQNSSAIYRVVNDLHHRQRFGHLSVVYSEKLKLVLVTGEEPPSRSPPRLVVVVPGIFRTGTLSGRMRRELQDELRDFAVAWGNLNFELDKGWILAVTDGDEVSYYVEKNVTLDELRTAGGIDGTREAALSCIFGRNRAVNLRSVARKKERADMKKAKADLRDDDSRLEVDSDPIEEPSVLFDEGRPDSEPKISCVEDVDKYDDVLKFISGVDQKDKK